MSCIWNTHRAQVISMGPWGADALGWERTKHSGSWVKERIIDEEVLNWDGKWEGRIEEGIRGGVNNIRGFSKRLHIKLILWKIPKICMYAYIKRVLMYSKATRHQYQNGIYICVLLANGIPYTPKFYQVIVNTPFYSPKFDHTTLL